MAALKCQVPCLGVYAKVCNRDANGHPMWKHVDADLCIASAQVRAPVFAHVASLAWRPRSLPHFSSISRRYLVHVSLGRSTASTAGWSPSTPRGTTTSRTNACKSWEWLRPGRARMIALVCTPAYYPRTARAKRRLLDPASPPAKPPCQPPLPTPPANPPCQPPCQPRLMWLLSIACSPFGKFGRGSMQSMQVLTMAPLPLPLPTGQIWTGKQWDSVHAIRCRPTYHGWGNDAKGTCSNSESSVSPLRTSSPKSDSKRKPKPALV